MAKDAAAKAGPSHHEWGTDRGEHPSSTVVVPTQGDRAAVLQRDKEDGAWQARVKREPAAAGRGRGCCCVEGGAASAATVEAVGGPSKGRHKKEGRTEPPGQPYAAVLIAACSGQSQMTEFADL